MRRRLEAEEEHDDEDDGETAGLGARGDDSSVSTGAGVGRLGRFLIAKEPPRRAPTLRPRDDRATAPPRERLAPGASLRPRFERPSSRCRLRSWRERARRRSNRRG